MMCRESRGGEGFSGITWAVNIDLLQDYNSLR